jgi:hypothetical protein
MILRWHQTSPNLVSLRFGSPIIRQLKHSMKSRFLEYFPKLSGDLTGKATFTENRMDKPELL